MARCRERWRIEAAFCRLISFRGFANVHDKLAANFLSAVELATYSLQIVLIRKWTILDLKKRLSHLLTVKLTKSTEHRWVS